MANALQRADAANMKKGGGIKMLALLELTIGLALLYLLVAVLASFLVEAVASYTNLRARGLERFIAQSFGESLHIENSEWAKALYAHPVIESLFTPTAGLLGTGTPPSYIPSTTFASTLIDLIRAKGSQLTAGTALQVNDVKALLERGTLPPGLAATLETSLSKGLTSIDAIRTDIEQWFNANMERASGWYKRHTQLWLFACALLVAAAFNLDSFYVANTLFRQPELATKAADLAQRINPGDGSAKLETLGTDLKYLTAFDRPSFDPILDEKRTDSDRESAALNLVQRNHLNFVDGLQAQSILAQLAKNRASNPLEAFEPITKQLHLVRCPATLPSGWAELADGARDVNIWMGDFKCRMEASGADVGALSKEAERLITVIAASPARTLDVELGRLAKNYLIAVDKDRSKALTALRDYIKARQKSAAALQSGLNDVLSQLPEIGLLCEVAHLWTPARWLRALLGWLTTAFLASLGAPFWFELIGRLVNLRSVGIKPVTATNLPK